jgi:transcription initiation factor TFIIH subunit 3
VLYCTDDSGFLTILLETAPAFWDYLDEDGLSEQGFVEQVCFQNLVSNASKMPTINPSYYSHLQIITFIRAYTLLNDRNRLALFTVGASSTSLLFATSNCGLQHSSLPPSADPASYILDKLKDAIKHDEQQQFSKKVTTQHQHRFSMLSGALSRALCFINKVQQLQEHDSVSGDSSQISRPISRTNIRTSNSRINNNTNNNTISLAPRVMCITGCPDAPSQYISMMNAIFASQRQHVAIDCCKLGPTHSVCIQQASYMTGGVYIKPKYPGAVLQYLFASMSADPSTRRLLKLPKANSSVDFRASCFCHRNRVDVGFVCSVCLSVFCDKVKECSTCSTVFT